MTTAFSTIVSSHNFGGRLLDIFGLRGQLITAITMECREDKPVIITITRMCTRDEADKVAAYMTEYALVRRGKDSPTAEREQP